MLLYAHMNELDSTQFGLAVDHLRKAGNIPYNTATGHYHVAGLETDPRFGGDCRFIAQALCTQLQAIDLDAIEVEKTNISGDDPRRHTGVLVQNLPTPEGRKRHFLDSRIQMRDPIPVYKPGIFETTAYPVVNVAWTRIQATVNNDGKFSIERKIPFRDITNHFEFDPSKPLPEVRATPLEVVQQQGRTFIFVIVGDDGGLYQMSYTLNGGRISMKRIGGLGERNNIEKATQGTDKFHRWMERVTQASTVTLPEIEQYFDGAAQLHKGRTSSRADTKEV